MTELISAYYHKNEIGFHFPITVNGSTVISSHYPDDIFKGAIAANKKQMKKYSGFSQKNVGKILRKAEIDRKLRGRVDKIFNLEVLTEREYPDVTIANISTKTKGKRTQVKVFNPYTQNSVTECTSDFNKNQQKTIPFNDTYVLDYWGLDTTKKYDKRTNSCHHAWLLRMQKPNLFGFGEAIPDDEIQKNTSILLQFLQELNQPVPDYVINYSYMANSDMFDDAVRQVEWKTGGDLEHLYFHDEKYMNFIREQIAKQFGKPKGPEHGHEKLDIIKKFFT